MGQFAFQIEQTVKTQINILFPDGGIKDRLIHTGQADIAPRNPCFIDIDLAVVKPTIIVEHRNHKLQGIIGLEKKTLITLYSKRR
ncbi:hypothetical protein D3C86_1556180 [compost metagenome]